MEYLTRKNRTIVVPFDQKKYPEIVKKAKLFRDELNIIIEKKPELFPSDIKCGYLMKEIRHPKKSDVPIRRIQVGPISYTVRPSFVMPCHTALTDDVEKAMFLRKSYVPFWALSHVSGKDSMFWYRIEQNPGRNSLVGATIKDPDLLPEHVAADEKHSRLKGNKIYVPTTAGAQCILGAGVSEDAAEKGLTEAYG